MDDSRPLQSRLLHCADCAPREGLSRRGLLFGALGTAATLAACSTPPVAMTSVMPRPSSMTFAPSLRMSMRAP